MSRYFILVTVLAILLITGCRSDRPAETGSGKDIAAEENSPLQPGCRGCHQNIDLDPDHRLACTECHLGDNGSATKETAHQGLVTSPADTTRMERSCGRCHREQVEGGIQSLHFTLAKVINRTRTAFGITPVLASLHDIPDVGEPVSSKEELVNDLLRRRCLRCHVHTAGDDYALVSRGRGCAACHLQFLDGRLQSHAFVRPSDRQCLSCHYGNHVGADYHGLYEHDYNWEYRTPYITTSSHVRPYGVEAHELVPDIHQQRGLICIDCHDGPSLMQADAPQPSCAGCHGWKPGDRIPAVASLTRENDSLVLRSRSGSGDHPVPGLHHPAHRQYGDRVDCQVCHGQWAFNDSTTHLLLAYGSDADEWERLTVQSSSEVEAWLEHNLDSDDPEQEAAMEDQLTGRKRAGIWLQGYTQRRWEHPVIAPDSNGRIRVFRPILDLRLSAVDREGAVLFDNLSSTGGLLPYTPHTTGPAGLFYRQRFSDLLPAAAGGRKK